MPFDADKEAVKITTMTTDLMSHDSQSLPKDASCSLMNEWHNLSADQRNATWNALKNDLPSDERKEDAKTGLMTEAKSNNAFGAVVTGDIRANGDAFGIQFHGKDEQLVSVMDFSDRGNDKSSALAFRMDEKAFRVLPNGWCETGHDGI